MKQTLTYNLDDANKWQKVYSRTSEYVDSIDIHNISGAVVFKSPTQSPTGENYESLDAGAVDHIEEDPFEIWMKKSGAASQKVKITVRWFSDDAVKRVKAKKDKWG